MGILMHEIYKFTIRYSTTKARERREKILTFEGNLRTGSKNDENILSYNIKKEKLSMTYDEVGNSIKVKNRCNWYEFGKKSNKFLLNPGKKCGFKMC